MEFKGKIEELKIIANSIRKLILKQIYESKSGHPGGSLSAADILSVLYFDEMKIDVNNPRMRERDRFVLSKGHASSALYATLALKGYISESDLSGFRKTDSFLEGHPTLKIPGIDINSGSLGQGLSIANGMALASRLDQNPYRVYCLIGDGECNEGQIWEAAMTTAQHKLDNVCVIVDNNGLQLDGRNADIKNVDPLDKKFESFGWHVVNINGNDIEQVLYGFEVFNININKPTAIIAKTVKGYGVSQMENNAKWHGKAPSKEEYDEALRELEVIRL